MTDNALPFHVEKWGKDFEPPFETMGKAANLYMARAMFDALVKYSPQDHIMLRIGISVVRRHPEPKPEQESKVVSLDAASR